MLWGQWGGPRPLKLRIREFGAWRGLSIDQPLTVQGGNCGPEGCKLAPRPAVSRQAAGLLWEADRVINGIWSNYRDSKAPHLFLGPDMRFLRRVGREGGAEVVRRWQRVGESSLARPVPGPLAYMLSWAPQIPVQPCMTVQGAPPSFPLGLILVGVQCGALKSLLFCFLFR